MNARDLPHKGAYVRVWRLAKTIGKTNPGALVTAVDWFAVPITEALAGFRRALHLRISERGGLPIRWDQDLWRAWHQDQSAIRAFRLHRVVQVGSGLRTRAARRAAPDVHARFREREEY